MLVLEIALGVFIGSFASKLAWEAIVYRMWESLRRQGIGVGQT